jgi:predicted phage baseplate assembly protein
VLNGLFPNAVHAIQHQTIVNEAMGSSTGQPDQTFSFTQVPVLAGEIIEVREVAGLRANVEWRIVAFEVLGRTSDIAELESLLASEGTQTEISIGDLRLTRDRNKRVTEVWVRWYSRRHLLFSGPNDRDYVVDRAQGLLLFGDGTNGKVPPSGAAILARQYRTGGGKAGNVEAGKISQLLAPAGGIEEAFNPLVASGGADGESPKQYEIRAPQSIRHRGRALLAADYEAMALEASPAVGFARVIPGRDPNGRRMPGWITLLIIPRTAEARPIPSFGLREEIRQYIEERTAAELAAGHRITVTAPNYLPIDVDTTIVPVDPAEAGSVEQSVLASLEAFFHPLTGGPEGAGWELGRDLFASDVAAVLEHVRGVDYVRELHLLLNSELQDESVEIADDRIVVAGQFRVNIVEA